VTPRGYAQVFRRLERFLNEIRVVALNSSRGYTDLSWSSSKVVAEDLVDLAMCGTISQLLHEFGVLDDAGQIAGSYYWQLREQFHSGRR